MASATVEPGSGSRDTDNEARRSAGPMELPVTRSLASVVPFAMFVLDATGNLVYFNAAAEPLLGASYDDVGPMPPDRWRELWSPMNIEGTPIPLEHLPIMVALRKRRPAHGWLDFVGLDGVHRRVEATAFPLEREDGLLLGSMGLFWETADD